MSRTFAELRDSYAELWQGMEVTRSEAAEKEARAIIAGKAHYLEVQKLTGVPWFVAGIIHVREGGSPPDWRACMHNGEEIIGTGRVTRLVPVGRGAFKTFEEAAVDAFVTLEHFDQVTWDEANGPLMVAWVTERMNGFGYRNGPKANGVRYPAIPSPYLWGATNRQERGKYVSDGEYDPDVMDKQIGSMALLKVIMTLDASARFGVPARTAPGRPAPRPVTKETKATGLLAALAAMTAYFWQNITWLGPIVVAIVIMILIYLLRPKPQKSPKAIEDKSND